MKGSIGLLNIGGVHRKKVRRKKLQDMRDIYSLSPLLHKYTKEPPIMQRNILGAARSDVCNQMLAEDEDFNNNNNNSEKQFPRSSIDPSSGIVGNKHREQIDVRYSREKMIPLPLSPALGIKEMVDVGLTSSCMQSEVHLGKELKLKVKPSTSVGISPQLTPHPPPTEAIIFFDHERSNCSSNRRFTTISREKESKSVDPRNKYRKDRMLFPANHSRRPNLNSVYLDQDNYKLPNIHKARGPPSVQRKHKNTALLSTSHNNAQKIVSKMKSHTNVYSNVEYNMPRRNKGNYVSTDNQYMTNKLTNGFETYISHESINTKYTKTGINNKKAHIRCNSHKINQLRETIKKLVNAQSPGSPKIKEKKKYILTEEELKIYGEKFIEQYYKIDLLGKGGCALVWLGKQKETGDLFALKQFSRASPISSYNSAKSEILISQRLEKYISMCLSAPEGMENISRLIDLKENKHDKWLIYELGGISLSKLCFEIKGQFMNSERVYWVHYRPFYRLIKKNPETLKVLTRQILMGIRLLSQAGIVHADLKSDNILVDTSSTNLYSALTEEEAFTNFSVKLVDFGSSLSFSSSDSNLKSLHVTTPEYLPPECLSLKQSQTESYLAAIDIWSVGVILLEIATGFPVWFSLKGMGERGQGKAISASGLFAMGSRDTQKIVERQHYVSRNVRETLKLYESWMVRDPQFLDLVERMLIIDPNKRLSIDAALEHPYLGDNIC